MPLIDDKVRAAFPGLSDEEIEDFYRVADSIRVKRVPITETDLGLAMISRELGWQALKDYLEAVTGDSKLSADDIATVAHAASYTSRIERLELYSAIYGASSEASSKKTVNARKKSLKQLSESCGLFEILEGM